MTISKELLSAAAVMAQCIKPAPSWSAPKDAETASVVNLLIQNRVSLPFLADRAQEASKWLARAPNYQAHFELQRIYQAKVSNYYQEVARAYNERGIEHILFKSIGFPPPRNFQYGYLGSFRAFRQSP